MNSLRWRMLLLTISLSLAASLPVALARAEGGAAEADLDLFVSPAVVDPELRPIADGVAEWVRERVGGSGLAMLPGRTMRRLVEAERKAQRARILELRKAGGSQAAEARLIRTDRVFDTRLFLEQGARLGVVNALLVDLRKRDGKIEADFRLYEVASGKNFGGGLVVADPNELILRSEEQLGLIFSRLGVKTPSPTTETLKGENMNALSAITRAIQRMDRKDLAGAWLEIDGVESLTVEKLRKRIAILAARPTTSTAERARLASVRGDAESAWQLIAEDAPAAYRDPVGSRAMLVAAGETQLARGVLDQSRAYFEKAVEVAPTDPDAMLGLARVAAAEGKLEVARTGFERAAELAPESPRPLELAAAVERKDEAAQAEFLLRAADRHAKQLNSAAGQQAYGRVVQLQPQLAPRAAKLSGDLHASVGEYDQALTKYRQAAPPGREGPALLHAVAQTQAVTMQVEESQRSYERLLGEVDPDNAAAMVELGGIYQNQGKNGEAVSVLMGARKLEPENPKALRGLAIALSDRNQEGDKAQALQLYEQASVLEPMTSRDLRQLAVLKQETGDLAGASEVLQRAVEERELDLDVQKDLVAVMRAQGDSKAASVWAQRFASSGLSDMLMTAEELEEYSQGGSNIDGFEKLSELVASFDELSPGVSNVVVLGIRERKTPRDRVFDWLRVRISNVGRMEQQLQEAIAAKYTVHPAAELGEFFAKEVENLYDFQSKASRSVDSITDLNLAFETDAVFLASVLERSGNLAAKYGTCWREPHFELQLRRLSGQTDPEVEVLSNTACLRGGPAGEFGDWNIRAAVTYGFILMLLLFPFVRGWGHVTIQFEIPRNTCALFAVRLSTRPGKVKDRSDKTQATSDTTFRKQLGKLDRGERRLMGDRMIYKWVPARRTHYYLSVRGPLVDLNSNQLIGEFLEERTVQVKRGERIKVDFDLRSREAAITVEVKMAGEPLQQARVAVRGIPNSVRYCQEGKSLVYLKPGDYVILIGGEDRVAEMPLHIEEAVPSTLNVELSTGAFFEGCPGAVTPYLEGDFATAADVLEAAGQELIAHEIRALLRTAADAGATQTAFLDAGETVVNPVLAGTTVLGTTAVGATQVQFSSEENARRAPLLEQQGEYRDAGDAYRGAGDLVNAGRCYEEAYDWQNAIECYQDIGDTERVLALMEQAGDVYDAGCLAAENEQWDRAIHNLQKVESRHPRYIETCRKLAEILMEKGEAELATEKFGEAIDFTGTADAPLELLAHYGSLLERADRTQDALSVYEVIRRRDLQFGDVNARIEGLKKSLSQPPAGGTTTEFDSDSARTVVAPGRAQPAAETAPPQTRYEIMDELGRGGMGVVYKARDTHLHRVVALKVLSEHLRQHQSALDLFLREARSAAALNHRNIVIVYDAGQEGTMDFISMEYLEGAGLDQILKQRGALGAKTVASIGLQVAAGLDYAQRNKIIHRDIKPSNLFVTRDKVVKILDFGLAKMVEEVRRASTVIGGTPNYMAPEQAIGNPTDHRADLYALGASLFHLVTGTVPFESGDVTYHHAHTPPPDPRERELGVPDAMAELILKLMAKEPEDRFQSAREVAVILQQVLKS